MTKLSRSMRATFNVKCIHSGQFGHSAKFGNSVFMHLG